ncbi:hypothetical protein L3Y34_016227 [Caenorhabditis briggsae]|uniref:Protein CBR-OSM-7 n=2 Tax=Caenorhabditis briggsae TaxID=6238 RepID=A0AAE9DX44_CAEBR|nr:hypothetical protein L3Y34_016227 [Caenorhabditis briggsae]
MKLLLLICVVIFITAQVQCLEVIEDVDELETTRKKAYSIPDYCTRYADNFKSYCSSGAQLEKVFPTPKPFFSTTTTEPKLNYCEGNAEKYKKECEKEGFLPEVFCKKYRELCGNLEKVDADTTRSVVDDDADSLETPAEFEEHQKNLTLSEKVSQENEESVVEAQGAGTDEVTVYCTNYIENYNFYCVGDMAPEHKKFCDSYKRNCPDRVSLKQSGSFLGNDRDSETSDSTSSEDKTYLYKGTKKEYCEKFSVNYEYYCKGTIENAEIFTKFCPSYKKACVTANQKPSNPFSPSKGQTPVSSASTSDFPDVEHPSAGKSKSSRRRGKKIKKLRPCSIDCDERIFPHCTKQCKCDYDYPAVQKFCNPPPLPMFLNTCRLWYYGCPKYEQYHYASQFIYSKAEKGKVLEGPKTQTTFQLLAPSGETLPYKPARFRRDTVDMVLWPMDNSTDFIGYSEGNIVDNWDSSNSSNASKDRIIQNPTIPSLQNSLETQQDKMVKLKNGTMVHLVAAPKLPPHVQAKDQVIKDPSTDTKPPDLPRSKKTTGGEAVPVYSDSVFSNALAQYNTLTDSRGILHRPRSRSPFTKPGLWEPNPDDPHNRDHANKYYYHPYSVGVDWLQGQLTWGAHFAVPAAGVGGTDGFSAVHFPSLGTFLNIPDDYD